MRFLTINKLPPSDPGRRFPLDLASLPGLSHNTMHPIPTKSWVFALSSLSCSIIPSTFSMFPLARQPDLEMLNPHYQDLRTVSSGWHTSPRLAPDTPIKSVNWAPEGQFGHHYPFQTPHDEWTRHENGMDSSPRAFQFNLLVK
jgi:hypothetical protein